MYISDYWAAVMCQHREQKHKKVKFCRLAMLWKAEPRGGEERRMIKQFCTGIRHLLRPGEGGGHTFCCWTDAHFVTIHQ